MAASEYVEALNGIQRTVTAALKPLGFKRSGRTHNRTVEDGMVQVVNFQMGEYPIGKSVIPGIRESYYGWFTVNLGVTLPAVLMWEQSAPIKGCVQDYHCEIRTRLGTLMGRNRDVWWRLDREVPETTALVVHGLEQLALPFFDRFAGYARVLEVLEREGTLPLKNEGRSALAGAMVCVTLGKVAWALHWFGVAAAYAKRAGHAGFSKHVAEIRERCGV